MSSLFKHHNGTKTPKAVLLLIGLNCLIYLMQASSRKTMNTDMALVPKEFINNPVSESKTLVTSMFSHANLTHLFYNMFAIFQFGVPVEHVYGLAKFLIIYFGSGIGSNIMYALTHQGQDIPLLGASAAISGIMSAYFLEFQETKDMTGWLLFQLLGAVLYTQSNISYSSHLWGFIIGAIIWGILPASNETLE
jgi:membrane associated rhomboid family serine protease